MRGMLTRAGMLLDRVEENVGVGREGVVAEAQNRVAGEAKAFVSCRIFGFSQVVDTAIQFDHKPELRTQEVDDEARDRRLSAKLEILKLTPADHRPENRLGARHP